MRPQCVRMMLVLAISSGALHVAWMRKLQVSGARLCLLCVLPRTVCSRCDNSRTWILATLEQKTYQQAPSSWLNSQMWSRPCTAAQQQAISALSSIATMDE